jgi:hypothetical protein
MTPKRMLAVGVCFALLGMLALPAAALAETIHAKLTGYEETPLTLSTPAGGKFKAHINESGTMITYELSYEGLEGSVLQAPPESSGR